MMTFICLLLQYISFFFNDTATTEIYTLSLHDALPIFIKNGDMWITARAQPASLADMRWLYPRLPSNGGGPVDVAIKMAGGFDQYVARNADIRIGAARIRGNAGVTLADTFALHDTDLRFANVDTRLIEQIVPQFESPRRGTLNGRARLAGGIPALRVDGDIALTDPGTGTSRLAAVADVGLLGLGADPGLPARHLRLPLVPVQADLPRRL